jgi:hypothetical protein
MAKNLRESWTLTEVGESPVFSAYSSAVHGGVTRTYFASQGVE